MRRKIDIEEVRSFIAAQSDATKIYIGSFILYVVAFKMIIHEPFIDKYLDPVHDLYENSLPLLGAVVLTAKQYYRQRILKK